MTDVLVEKTGDKEEEQKQQLNILLVEDDPSIAKLIEGFLKSQGHNVTVLEGTEQTLRELRERKKNNPSNLPNLPNLAILDRGMDDGKGGVDKEGGFKVAKAIMDEQLGHPFVVLFTGSALEVQQNNTTEQLKEKGIDRVIAKGSKLLEFTLAVNSAKDRLKEYQAPQPKQI